jgi:hypothetical protein
MWPQSLICWLAAGQKRRNLQQHCLCCHHVARCDQPAGKERSGSGHLRVRHQCQQRNLFLGQRHAVGEHRPRLCHASGEPALVRVRRLYAAKPWSRARTLTAFSWRASRWRTESPTRARPHPVGLGWCRSCVGSRASTHVNSEQRCDSDETQLRRLRGVDLCPRRTLIPLRCVDLPRSRGLPRPRQPGP